MLFYLMVVLLYLNFCIYYKEKRNGQYFNKLLSLLFIVKKYYNSYYCIRYNYLLCLLYILIFYM